MKFVFYTNSISPHQLPLARELVKRLGEDNYRYIYTAPISAERKNLGWNETKEDWIICEAEHKDECRELLLNCEVLLIGIRDFDLIEQRCKAGKTTIYASERWFKPMVIDVGGRCRCRLPGSWRMFVPSYRKMANRLVRLANTYDCFRLMPYGVLAEQDFLSLGVRKDKLHVWGYCVEPSTQTTQTIKQSKQFNNSLSVLWVGRMLDWKQVDTIIRAVAAANKCPLRGNSEARRRGGFELTIVGDGPERTHLQKLTSTLRLRLSTSTINFLPPVKIDEVRKLMREHDVYALASNAQEGWGAAVNEAMVEGMTVLGTYEAGASATLLPRTNLFHAGDWRGLAKLLVEKSYIAAELPREFTPAGAAECVLGVCKEMV